MYPTTKSTASNKKSPPPTRSESLKGIKKSKSPKKTIARKRSTSTFVDDASAQSEGTKKIRPITRSLSSKYITMRAEKHIDNDLDNSDDVSVSDKKPIKTIANKDAFKNMRKTRSMSSKDIDSDSIGSHDTSNSSEFGSSCIDGDTIIENVKAVFDKIIDKLQTKLDIQNASDSFGQTTTDMEKSQTPMKDFEKEKTKDWGGRFGKEKNTTEVTSKVYLKGFKDEANKKFYGIALERLPNAKKHRKPWTSEQKKSDSKLSEIHKDKYHLLPNHIITHKSHALPNFLNGPETSLNMVTASTGKKSSYVIGQGNAQGYIEHEIGTILGKYQDKENFDLRWKSTDYFDKNNRLITRRIKLFALDAYGKQKDAKEFCEVMLGEFYLSANLAVLSDSYYAKELKEAVKDFSKACDAYVTIIQSADTNNDPNNRTVTFWENQKFQARARNYTISKNIIKNIKKTPIDKMSEQFRASLMLADAPETNKQATINMNQSAKLDRENSGILPRLIAQNTDPSHIPLSKKILEKIEDNDCSNLKEKFDTIQKLLETDTTDELRFFTHIKNFFNDLVKEEIITAQDMRAFIPQEVLESNKRIKFHNTPVSEVIMAILRKAD